MHLVVVLTIHSIVQSSCCESFDLPCLQMLELGDHACESYYPDETLEKRKHNDMFIALGVQGENMNSCLL